MSYRDDGDAARARADALALDLERSERERRDLVAEVAALKAEKVAARPAPPALSDAEVADLVARLRATKLDLRGSPPLRAALAALLTIAGLALFTVDFLLGGVVFGLGFMVAMTLVAPSEADPDRLIDAVLTAPESVTAIVSIGTGMGRRTLGLHTLTSRAWFRTERPDTLIVQLARRCPRAQLR